MVFDPQRAVDSEAPPPGTLPRPTDAPPPLGHVRDAVAVRALRTSLTPGPSTGTAEHRGTRARLRAWASRATGHARNRRVSEVAGAAEALATQCDALTDHVTVLEAVTADLATTLGAEVARLRAEVAHLRRLLEDSHDPSHE